MMEKQVEMEATTLDAESPAQESSKQMGNSLAKTSPVQVNNAFSTLNLFDPTQLAAAENYLSKVMRSDKGGIKSVNDGLAVLMRAQDLGLPFSTCIEHIHVINGKTGVDIHIVKALLLRAGCTWRCLKDYQPLYEYTDGINVYIDGSFPDYVERCISADEADMKIKAAGDNTDKVYAYPVKWYKDLSGNLYKNYQLNTAKFGIIVNKAQTDAVMKQGKIPVYRVPNVPVDFVTEYEITRTVNGKEVISIGRFSYSEAVAADMFTKDTYKKYPRVLIGHRAFTYAARDIASDVLFGVMESSELKIVSGKELDDTDVLEIQDVEVIK